MRTSENKSVSKSVVKCRTMTEWVRRNATSHYYRDCFRGPCCRDAVRPGVLATRISAYGGQFHRHCNGTVSLKECVVSNDTTLVCVIIKMTPVMVKLR
jgi:hypothetical protein